MGREPEVEVADELTRKPSQITLKPSEPEQASLLAGEPPVPPSPIPAPATEPPFGNTDARVLEILKQADEDGDLSSLANLFNSPRMIQVGTSLPTDLYLALCRLKGSVPAFVRAALENPLDVKEVMLGAKKMADARKGVSRSTVTIKVEPEQKDEIERIIQVATTAGVGLVTESKVVAGIIWNKAHRDGLI